MLLVLRCSFVEKGRLLFIFSIVSAFPPRKIGVVLASGATPVLIWNDGCEFRWRGHHNGNRMVLITCTCNKYAATEMVRAGDRQRYICQSATRAHSLLRSGHFV